MKYIVIFVSVFWLLAGCTPVNNNEGNTTDSSAQDSPPVENKVQESDRPDADYSRTQTTGDKAYKITYELVDVDMKEGEMPLNKHFATKVTVLDKDGKNAMDKIDIVVDAAMLHHGHGINVEPVIERKDGYFLAKGILFHMPGKWTFYVHVRTKGTRPPNLKTYGDYYKYCEQSRKDCAIFHAYLP